MVAGVWLGFVAMSMDTSVDSEIGRVQNIGRLAERGNYVTIAIGLFIGGCILTALAPVEKIKGNGARHVVQTSSGTLEFGETTLYIVSKTFGTALAPPEPKRLLIADVGRYELLHPQSGHPGELRLWQKAAAPDAAPTHVVLFPQESLQEMKQAVDILVKEVPTPSIEPPPITRTPNA
jgi:hypothetical protein